MNKAGLINVVAEKTEQTKKDVTPIVDAVFESIKEALQDGEKIQLQGFGNLEVRERAARKGRNPSSGEEIEIAACKTVGFKPSKNLKDLVNI